MGVEQSADVRSATAPDYDDIVRVIQLYVDGYNGDSASCGRRSTRTRGSFSRTAAEACTEVFSPTPLRRGRLNQGMRSSAGLSR